MQEGQKGLVLECCAPCCSVLVLLAAAACLLLLQFEAGTLAIVSEYLNGHLRRSRSQHIIACGKVSAGTRVVRCSSIPISYPDITCKDFPLCVIWRLGLAWSCMSAFPCCLCKDDKDGYLKEKRYNTRCNLLPHFHRHPLFSLGKSPEFILCGAVPGRLVRRSGKTTSLTSF